MTEKRMIRFTVQEVSDMTGLAQNTITNKCANGLPGAFREGRRWYLTPESLQALQEIKPRAQHTRPGKRIQLELEEEPQTAQEPAEEEKNSLPDIIKDMVAAADLPDIIAQPDLEFHDVDMVAEALIDAAWKLIGSAAEFLIRAGYRVRMAEEEKEDEQRQVS